jgi:hypothetical protein
MKKVYPLVFAITFCIGSNAQISRNSTLLGGSLTYTNSFSEYENLGDNKTNLLGLGISLGHAYKENRVIGINANYRHSKSVFNTIPGEKITGKEDVYEFGPFYRLYKSLGSKFNLFGQAELLAGWAVANEDYEIANTDTETKKTGGYAAITPGASYRLLKRLYVELFIPDILSFGYQKTKYQFEDPNRSEIENKSFFFNTRFNNYSLLSSIGFGFRFIL